MPDSLHVGVTVTRHLVTELQFAALCGVLNGMSVTASGPLVLHHGVCRGADEAAHWIVRKIGGWTIHGHPGHDPAGGSPWRSLRSLDDLDVTEPSKPYLGLGVRGSSQRALERSKIIPTLRGCPLGVRLP